MIRYRVRLPEDIQNRLAHLDPKRKHKIKAALDLLEIEPRIGKPLEQELTGFWSYPVPPLRIVYLIDSGRREIQVVGLDHRQKIYDLLTEQLRSRE
ncbi:MAG: type II toxin-antitoxin system RelE/ParE family toxin [Candidatus Omnitrophica bacterium]|nr:type II toxin-antitoxin system RelE/ParE family toxin [Candidatus Omnitrophota bacterium]